MSFAAVGGAAMVDDAPAHGTGERKPGMWMGEIRGLHDGAKAPELVGKLFKAKIGKDGEQKTIGGR